MSTILQRIDYDHAVDIDHHAATQNPADEQYHIWSLLKRAGHESYERMGIVVVLERLIFEKILRAPGQNEAILLHRP